MASLTEQLVQLIRAKPITDEDRESAARFLLDTVANALGARNTEPGRMLRAWFARQGADAGRQAFLLGGLAHILEMAPQLGHASGLRCGAGRIGPGAAGAQFRS
jgi:hypothetical protein